jgi:hypothetical protein
MRGLLFILLILFIFSCKKEKCYDCEQEVINTSSPLKKGYPVRIVTKFMSCGDHINVIDNDTPFVESTVINDTTYTLYINAKCVRNN